MQYPQLGGEMPEGNCELVSGGGDRELKTMVATWFASILPALSAIPPSLEPDLLVCLL